MMSKGLSESVKRQKDRHHKHVSVQITIHTPDRQNNTRESRDNKIHNQDGYNKNGKIGIHKLRA